MEKDLEPRPSPPNFSKVSSKFLPLLVSINWSSLVTSWVVVRNIYLKMYLAWCTNTHRDVKNSVNHRMVKNTKTWVPWEQNIILLRNKKFLSLCLQWHFLKSYYFVAEVTFKRFIKFSYYINLQSQS